jgi:hypothetical protein
MDAFTLVRSSSGNSRFSERTTLALTQNNYLYVSTKFSVGFIPSILVRFHILDATRVFPIEVRGGCVSGFR